MDNYRIIDMSNDKYDAAGIRLSSGKNCIYFKNKDCEFNSIIIGRDYNVNIAGNEIALVFKKEDTVEDIIELTRVFVEALNIDTENISFVCNVNNEVEEKEMLDISNSLDIPFSVKRSEKYKQFLMSKQIARQQKLEEERLKRLEEERLKKIEEESKKEIFIDENVVEKQADDFFKVPVNEEVQEVIEEKKSISDIVSEDWEQTKEESLILQKDIEPKIYEKPIIKKKKSKIVIILIILSIILLIGAGVLLFMGLL